MNEKQISTALSSDPLVKFGGVFSSNEVPHYFHHNTFYVYNTAPSQHPGKHWIVIYCGETTECFDSLAEEKTSIYFKTFLYDNINFSTLPVQTLDSISCGHYCLFYIFMRCRGFPMQDIVIFLSGWNNEEFIINFIEDVYGYNVSTITF